MTSPSHRTLCPATRTDGAGHSRSDTTATVLLIYCIPYTLISVNQTDELEDTMTALTTTDYRTRVTRAVYALDSVTGPSAQDIETLKSFVLAALDAQAPTAVHLVGVAADPHTQTPQIVQAAFVDASEAHRWAELYSNTADWLVSGTCTEVLHTVPLAHPGGPAPAIPGLSTTH